MKHETFVALFELRKLLGKYGIIISATDRNVEISFINDIVTVVVPDTFSESTNQVDSVESFWLNDTYHICQNCADIQSAILEDD